MRHALTLVLLCACATETATLVRAGDTPCSADADCVITHNVCDAQAVCSEQADRPDVTDQFCDPPEFETPDASLCTCVEDRCEADGTDG